MRVVTVEATQRKTEKKEPINPRALVKGNENKGYKNWPKLSNTMEKGREGRV